MKDAQYWIFKLVFAVLLVAVIAAYSYFILPTVKGMLLSDYARYSETNARLAEVSGIAANPDSAQKDIAETDRQLQLAKMGFSYQLNEKTVADDIMANADLLGIKVTEINIANPIALVKGEDGSPALMSVTAQIAYEAPYDGGMYYIAEFEQSKRGAYRVDDFSFVPSPSDAALLSWNTEVRLLYYEGDASQNSASADEDGADLNSASAGGQGL